MPNPFKNLFAQPAPRMARTATESMLAELPVGEIRPDPEQPRKSFDEEHLANMGQSMLRRQQQPIVALYEPSVPSKPWLLIDGECRWRAAQKAGMHTIQALLLREELTREQRLEMQLTANLFRADLTPIEQANAFKALMDLKGWTMGSQLAQHLSLSQATVSRALALLQLPPAVRQLCDNGTLAPSTAYELTKAPPEAQLAIAAQAASGGWTRTEVKEAVQAARINPEPAREYPSLTLSGSDVGLPDLPDSESAPVETIMTYTFCDAEVVVRFPRPASTVDVVMALEGCLEQARGAAGGLAPLRIAA